MFRCKLCNVSVSGERNFEMHLKGKKHRLRLHLVSDNGDDEFADAEPFEPWSKDYENLPEPEDLCDQVCQLQQQIDAHKDTLIGLDFLVEAVVKDAPEKLEYFCLLCDKKGPKRIAISHVQTFNHQLKYLRTVFPSVTKQVSKKCTSRTPKSVLSAIVNEVCTKIESMIGRFKPAVVDRDILVETKSQYTELLIKKHCSRVKEIKSKELIDIVNKDTEKHGPGKMASVEQDKRDSGKDGGKEQVDEKAEDEDSDDVQVLSVVSKVKVLVDITKEDTEGAPENKESAKDVSGSSKEKRNVSQSGGSNLVGDSKNGHLRRSLSNLSSISSTSSPEQSLVEITSSPRSSIGRRSPKRFSPVRSRKSLYPNPAHQAHYGRGHYMDRVPKRLRSRTRSRSRSISWRRSRSRQRSRSSRSSSGSRKYAKSHNRVGMRRMNKARAWSPARPRSRSPIRLRSRSPIRLRSRSPMRRRSRSPIKLLSRSPVRLRSRSPMRLMSRSPIRLRSRSPMRLGSRSPVRLSPSPKRVSRRQRSSSSVSPSRQRDRLRSKGLSVRGDGEKRMRGGPAEDRSGKSATHAKPVSEFSVWEKFRIEADELEIEMAASRSHYQQNPEEHPRYAAEWKIFYSRRMGEAKGHADLDPRSEEFKLEWIEFWSQKMNELLNQEFRERKDAIRKKLGLPDEPPPHEMKRRPEKRPSNSDDDWIPPPPRRLTDRASPSMPNTHPVATERLRVTNLDPKCSWKALTGGSIETNFLQKDANTEFEELWCDANNGLIHILRIVSALEEQLGSLGPRVNNHLSNALALQRGGISLIPLIYSSDIVVLFETVKEKLLGQLQTGIVKRSMVSAVNKAVQSISNLLEKASRYKRPIKSESKDYTRSLSPFDFDPNPRIQPRLKEAIESITDLLIPASSHKASVVMNPKPAEDTTASVSIKSGVVESEPLVVPGIGEVDKDAIAQHIAMALIERGRTDVSEAELLKLIEEVVGLAQAQVPDNTAAEKGFHSSQEDLQRSNVGGQEAPASSSLSDLMAQVCDRACTSETTANQPSEECDQPKYSLIAVDLEEDPCKKSYQKLSVESLIMTLNQLRSEGRADPGEIEMLISRIHSIREDEQVRLLKYIQDQEAEAPKVADLLSYVLLQTEPSREREMTRSTSLPISLSGQRVSPSPVVETSAMMTGQDQLGEVVGPTSSALENRLGSELASRDRENMDLAHEANLDLNFTATRASLNDPYSNEHFRESSHSYGRVQENYEYSRVENPRQQLASSQSGDYIQARSLSYDERDYVSAHGSSRDLMTETNYGDYYPENVGYDVANRNANFRMRQYHGGGNSDPVQDFNERMFYQQQMAHQSDYGGRDPRSYSNYPSGDYFNY
ncbi:uncharacterized protein LOC124170646 isoform X2 [Ischnura elegans]|uniref:uncharacterized protein LOC124170646 isoform X2 n=1 Tax=Ischnura elegans TaxID=197161 RepID=UPI001ED899CF|nr:uncharacterized protein LOC124170646 isoform X2 [Ischnura elegans]